MRDPNQIRTYHGINMDPFNPKSSDICIEDIAHALAMLCRANGHIHHFYSVAQHCLNCEQEAQARGLNTRVRLFCLLHDATECYISDLTRPVKRHFPLYYEAEGALVGVIYDTLCKVRPTPEEYELIGAIDDCLLYHEFLALCGVKMFDDEPRRLGTLCFDALRIDMVRAQYVDRYRQLYSALAAENGG
ncbi:MAG: phosphohydrolase [Candidatus Fimivivens sp.]